MRKGSRNTDYSSRVRAQELRQTRSISETILWSFLRKDKLGFRVRTQVRVGPYFLDFYCAEAALCVEIDGEQHADRVDRDAARDAYLLSRGIETIRIPSLDLFEESGLANGRWLRLIEARCIERSARVSDSSPPYPPLQDEPLGEGE